MTGNRPYPPMSAKQKISLPRVCVAHLVWGPLGVTYLERFLESYFAYDAACPHDLIVVLNNVDNRTRTRCAAILRGVEHRTFVPARTVMDLEAYRLVMGTFAADAYCFLNSYSRILGPSWLSHYISALQRPEIGLVGATGSYRSMRDFSPWRVGEVALPPLKRAALDFRAKRRALRVRWQFPAAPSPFVRTNGFAIRAATIPLLAWPECRSKWDTWRWEMGRDGLTARVRRVGLRCVIIDRSGCVYDMAEWPKSHTFWSGSQGGLLIADNRSDEYDSASDQHRACLARANWLE